MEYSGFAPPQLKGVLARNVRVTVRGRRGGLGALGVVVSLLVAIEACDFFNGASCSLGGSRLCDKSGVIRSSGRTGELAGIFVHDIRKNLLALTSAQR